MHEIYNRSREVLRQPVADSLKGQENGESFPSLESRSIDSDAQAVTAANWQFKG